jgi:hypothetical protein
MKHYERDRKIDLYWFMSGLVLSSLVVLGELLVLIHADQPVHSTIFLLGLGIIGIIMNSYQLWRS